MSESLLPFFGRFHPLIVHLPIGFLSFWLIFELFYRNKEKNGVRFLLAIFTFLSALVSVILGFFLSWEGGYDEHLLQEHRISGIILAVFTFLLLATTTMINNGLFFHRAYYLLLIASFVVMCYTGHHGGSLTHGSDFLEYKSANESSNEAIVPIADVQKAYVFEDFVLPIFKKKCTSCHNEEKKKGGLRLDSYTYVMNGGENGSVIESGNSAKSYLAEVVLMNKDEEMAMPPKGKQPLTQEEIEVILWWINQNAKEKTRVEELDTDPKILTTLNSLAGNAPKTSSFFETTTAKPVEMQALELVKSHGFLVSPIAQNSPFLDVRIQASVLDTLGDDATKALQNIKENIVWLDLAKSKITDGAAETFALLTNLQKLNLSQTQVGDAFLQSISKLPHLHTVNLTATKITAKGLEKLNVNPAIEKVFAWQTALSDVEITSLKNKFPKVHYEFGRDTLVKPHL